MTDQNHTPDQQVSPQPPEEAVAVPPDGDISSESAADSPDSDKTLESPILVEPIAPASEQPTVTLPSVPIVVPSDEVQPPSPETPPAAPDELQPTAVLPQVTAASDALDAVPADPVPPPTDAVAPAADLDQTLSDTSDFTLTDVTLTDAAGGGLLGWIRSRKSRPDSAEQSEALPATSPASKTRHWGLRPWQWSLVGVGAVVLIIAVLIGVDSGLYYNKVHQGVRVAGQNLSGMTSNQATQTLDALAEKAQEQPITLKGDGQNWKILPGDLDTNIDVPAAVSKAMALTRKGNVLTDLVNKIELYFSGYDMPIEGTFDEAKMDALLARISTALDVPATNATLAVNDGVIEVMEGKQGTVVDKETLRAALSDLLFTFHSTELTIPMVTTSPDFSAVDITPALEQANVMISEDVVLTRDGETVATLTPDEILTYLDVARSTGSDGSEIVPVLSAKKMETLFDAVDKKVSTPGINATFEVNTETLALTLVDGSDGEGVDRIATAAALTRAALDATDRTAEVILHPIPPDLTTEEVQAMGIKDLLGDYKTTPYVGTKNRQINVRLATKLCSGVFLAPGEEFNTDERLGVRDAAHGWASAPGIVGPGQLEDVPGGGICQVSTTLFNAALVSGLEITKRYNHSIFINHYPDGRDATVTAGGKNMCFRNDTADYIFIYGWSSGINTHFYIFGVNDGRQVLPIEFSGFSVGGSYPTTTIIDKSLPVGTTKEDFSGQRSRSCSITRTVIYADGTKKSQTWSSRWSMLPKVVLTNPAPATPTTMPGTTSSTEAPPAPTTTVP